MACLWRIVVPGLSTTSRSVVFGRWTCFICGGIVEDDALVTDKTLPGLVTDWERFLQAAEDGPMNELRQATRTGRPAGDGSFVTTVEKLTGRDLSKR